MIPFPQFVERPRRIGEGGRVRTPRLTSAVRQPPGPLAPRLRQELLRKSDHLPPNSTLVTLL